jgi:hypothetical protein
MSRIHLIIFWLFSIILPVASHSNDTFKNFANRASVMSQKTKLFYQTLGFDWVYFTAKKEAKLRH